MRRTLAAVGVAFLLAFLAPWTCSPDTDTGSGGPRDVGGDTGTDGSGDAGGDAPGDGSPDGGSDGGVCDENDFTATYDPTRLMILLDNSGSMDSGLGTTKWDQAKTALTTLLTDWAGSGRLVFGFDVFPDFECATASGIFCCDVTHPVVADCEAGNEADLVTRIGSAPAPTGKFDTPLCSGIDRFNDPGYAPLFTGGTGDRYLLVVSDGQEECNGSDFPETCGASPSYPGAVTVVTDLLSKGIRTFVIGFGSGVDARQLNVIAQNGGTDFDEYLVASNAASLQAAFEQIASEVVSCRFDVDWDSLAAGTSHDPSRVNFYCRADDSEPTGPDNVVPFDDGCADGSGWDWVDEDTVTFCETSCNDRLLAGDCPLLTATFGCDSFIL